MTTTERTHDMSATLARAAYMICDPDAARAVVRRPYRVEAGGEDRAVVTDGTLFFAIDAPADTLPNAPRENERALRLLTEPGDDVRWQEVDGGAFREWLGPFVNPRADWTIRGGIIERDPFDRNLIAFAIGIMPSDPRRIGRWTWNGVHMLHIDGEGWRIALSGLRRDPKYDDASVWEDYTGAEG